MKIIEWIKNQKDKLKGARKQEIISVNKKRIAWNYNRKPKTCINCNKIFLVEKYRLKQIKFCCMKCKQEYGLVNKKCENCKKIFIVNKARENRYHARFCSYNCYENFKFKYRIIKKCKYCNNKMIVAKWNKNKKFCSKKCYAKSKRLN